MATAVSADDLVIRGTQVNQGILGLPEHLDTAVTLDQALAAIPVILDRARLDIADIPERAYPATLAIVGHLAFPASLVSAVIRGTPDRE